MLEAFKQRIVIIGNSGSGKSTLADSLANLTGIPAVDLDRLHWAGNGYGVKRDEAAARDMVLEVAAKRGWVVEGVFGWLAEVAIPRATALIWLDLPWQVCRQGLLARGVRRGGTDADFTELMKWAEEYWQRQTSSSSAGHFRLFESFQRARLRLRTRHEVSQLLTDLRAGEMQARQQ
jgi:adenylate kinase family enzyme